jgi:hypothetical protein
MTSLSSKTSALHLRVNDERGVALFLTLILVSTLSVLTVSLMFLAQSESYSSGNYRLMTQARYGAEAGVQKAADFILNTNFGVVPGVTPGLIPTSQSPVQFNFKDVVLSSDPNHPSNFPDAATIAAFQAATNGSLAAGNSTINFTAYATLISIDQITDGYTAVPTIIQTWQITSDATIAGIRKSTVEVSAMIDSDKVPTIAYGAFGTSTGCGALNFQGNVKTNSYDSSGYTGSTQPPEFGTGGDVGSNGNLTISGHVDVNGNMSSPINGVGSCTNNGGVASTALTSSGAATVEGGAPLKLPQTVMLPTPPPVGAANRSTIPGPVAPTCAAMGLPAANCSVSGGTLTLKNTSGTPLKVPYVDLSGTDLVLSASSDPTVTNTYNIDGITMNNGSISIQSPSKSLDVKVNLTGLNPDGSAIPEVFHMQAGADAGGFVTSAALDSAGHPYSCTGCSQYDAGLLQFIYGGTGTATLQGHPSAACVFYMPNADVTFGGNSGLNGALIAHTLTINGGGNSININYDQSLSGKGQTSSAPMITAFSWKKY